MGEKVPAHTGGADLSICQRFKVLAKVVPAHTGGADLSNQFIVYCIIKVQKVAKQKCR